MSDRSRILDEACAAIVAGDAPACQAHLDRFRRSVARKPLNAREQATCGRQLDRLQVLAGAACEGIGAARAWLADQMKAMGGLDVYGPAGRQRVSTELSTQVRRF